MYAFYSDSGSVPLPAADRLGGKRETDPTVHRIRNNGRRVRALHYSFQRHLVGFHGDVLIHPAGRSTLYHRALRLVTRKSSNIAQPHRMFFFNRSIVVRRLRPCRLAATK